MFGGTDFVLIAFGITTFAHEPLLLQHLQYEHWLNLQLPAFTTFAHTYPLPHIFIIFLLTYLQSYLQQFTLEKYVISMLDITRVFNVLSRILL